MADVECFRRSPAEGPSSAAANAKSDKAKKWAAFRAQNYDGEGWGDDYGDDGGSPPYPPADAPARPGPNPSTSSPEVAGFANTLPPSVVANLASAQNGSRGSLPSQVTGPRMSTDLTRGIVVSGGAVPVKRAEGRDSPRRRSWIEQRSDSPKPIQPEDSQESRTASDTPTTPIPEADESATSPSDKRFSRSPQLPDLARMSMFGDDLFKSSTMSEEPPPMPAMPSPSTFSGAGLGVKQPNTTEGGPGTPGSITGAAQQTPPQITSASPSPPPAERPASPGDTAAQNNSAPAHSDSAAGSNIPQEGSVSPLVSQGAKTPDLQQAASTLSPSGMAGQVTAPTESTSNVSSLEESSATDLAREMSPSPLRSMSPAVPAVSGERSPQGDALSGATSPEKPAPVNDDASDPTSATQQTATNKPRSSAPRQSDILREEIIKSLGRAAATSDQEEDDGSDGSPTDRRQSTLDSGIRESTYLPAVYDDYWATTAGGKDADVPEVPSLPSGTGEEVAIAPLRPSSKSPGAPSAHPLRERFSWEQSSEGGPSSPASARPQDSEAHAEPSTTDTARSPGAVSHSPGPDREGTPRVEGPQNADAEEEEADVSRNESQLSRATAVEPDAQPKRLSLAAEKGLEEGSSTERLPTEPAEDHPALRDASEDSSSDATPRPSPNGSPKILPKHQSLQTLSFREIMALGTSQERAAKFEETRLQYAGMDQGLDSWIITLRADPEHEGASAIFNANGAAVPVTAPGGAKGQAQTSPTTGQAYYQQHLNASSVQSGGPGRSASVGLGSASPAATALKHSGNQAGVKSKELLFAAGKAGKGLLSKGKNKLRGSTGDKVFL